MDNNVLIAGVDGASWNFLMPWINDGELPALKRLLGSGSSGDLKTVVPPLSSAAWISMVTGKNPGKHGIYEYLDESGRLLTSKSVKSEKVWNVLSQHGKRCCIVGVPLTYPVEAINGYMVSGVLTPHNEKVYSYPSEIMSLLRKYDYRISVEYEKNDPLIPDQQNVIERRDHFLKEIYYAMERKYLALKELMNERWDFFMFVFTETTYVKDLFWDKKEVVLEFYKKFDSYLDDLIKTYSAKNPDPYIFVVSDHGFSASPKRSFNFRVWMNNEKILEDKRTMLQKIVPKVYKRLIKIKLSKLLFLLPRPKIVRESFQRRIVQSSGIYYKYPGIFIDKSGMKEDEYEGLRDKIIPRLREMRDPANNSKIFQIVEKRESVYSGENSKFAPDVVVIPMSNYANVFSYESDKLVEDIKLYLPGRHFSDMFGIFLAYGGSIRKGKLSGVSILDIFPTVLHILGIPIAKDVDGKVLTGIFKQNSGLSKQEVTYATEKYYANLSEKDRIRNLLKRIKT